VIIIIVDLRYEEFKFDRSIMFDQLRQNDQILNMKLENKTK